MSKSTEPRPYRRRHWLVNRSFQFRFVRAMLLVLLVMAAVAILGMYGALQLTIATYELRREAFIVILLSLWLSPVAPAWAEDASPASLAPAAHPSPRVGERLGFHGRWIGIPVGSGWIEVKEIVAIEGRPAYHIEVQGHTNEVLSTFYPIHDIIHSYVDVETLKPVRFEKDQREGRYRAHEVVTFDHQRAIATYRSLVNNAVKEIALPETFEDLISALYWFRRQPLQPGRSLSLNVYTDEKIFRTEIEVLPVTALELLKRGTFLCVVVEPKASFKGLLVKRGRLWAYLTADEHRLPLLVRVTTPWGPMSAVLDEASIPPTVQRNNTP